MDGKESQAGREGTGGRGDDTWEVGQSAKGRQRKGEGDTGVGRRIYGPRVSAAKWRRWELREEMR